MFNEPPIQERTLSINVQKELNRHKSLKGLIPLSCFIYDENKNNWQQKVFPREQKNIFISASFAQDPTNQDLQEGFYLTLNLLGNFWFAFKKQLRGYCLFNGLHNHQDIITANSSSYIELENSKMLVTNRKASSFHSKDDVKRGEPQYGEYAVKTPLGQFCYSFSKTVLIGSNPICDVMIKSEPFAGMLKMHKGHLHLINFQLDRIAIDGEEVTERVIRLADGQTLQIGPYSLSVHLPDELVDPLLKRIPDGSLCLATINPEGGDLEKLFLPASTSLLFGRGDVCDCIIDVDGISRRHAQVTVLDNHIEVLDFQSTNGTFINNSQVDKKRAYPGDIISFGNSNFLLCYYHG